MVRAFVRQNACACIFVSACGYGKDWHKNWIFASTFRPLQILAFRCPHEQGTHQSIWGVGEISIWPSRDIAEYPGELCAKFAATLIPILSQNQFDFSLSDALRYIPSKEPTAPPFCRQDGAGFLSQGDWSSPHSFDDVFHVLRKRFFQLIIHHRLDKQILDSILTNAWSVRHLMMNRFSHSVPCPMNFSKPTAYGISPDRSVPDKQRIRLHLLQQLWMCMDDPDKAVLPYLTDGVPIGSDTPILPYNCFPLQAVPDDYQPPLLTVHHTNWMSAEESPEIVQHLR